MQEIDIGPSMFVKREKCVSATEIVLAEVNKHKRRGKNMRRQRKPNAECRSRKKEKNRKLLAFPRFGNGTHKHTRA